METTEEELKQSQSDSWDSLVLTRDEANCKDEDLELWKIELKSVFDRIKSSELEQIIKSLKPEEADQHIVDAFLVLLGHRTKEERNQVLENFSESNVDLLKQAELVKYQEITLDDCKQIQSLLAEAISDNTEDMPTLFKDMTKWVSNLVEMKIASKRFPSEIDHLIEHDVAHEEESIPILEFDQIVIEKNKSYGIEDWSKIGYIKEDKSKPYVLERLYNMKKKLIKLKKLNDNTDYDKTRPPRSVIYLYNLLLELCGKDADYIWDHRTGYINNSAIIKERFTTDFAYDLTYYQMKAIKAFFDKYPKYNSMKTSCYKVIANYIKLKVIFNCRLYRALHGSETWLSKCKGWERFVFWKTEKFFIRENFTKLLEDTYALVKDLSGGDILKGLMIYYYYWDHINFLNPDVYRIIDALSIFITRMDSEEGKNFISFKGFDMYESNDDISLIETFPNRLCDFKLEYLTIDNCLFIQQKFDKFYLDGIEFGETAKKLFYYIDNMVQMRIALEKYNENFNINETTK